MGTLDFTKTVILRGNVEMGRYYRSVETLRKRFVLVPPTSISNALRVLADNYDWKIEPITDGFGAVVYRGQLVEGPCLIVKVGIFCDTHPPICDFAYNHLLLSYDPELPLARPLALDTTGELIPFPYVVMSELPGLSLLSLYEKGNGPDALMALDQVGQCLANLHAPTIPCEGFGALSPSKLGNLLSGQTPKMLQADCMDGDTYYRKDIEEWLAMPDVIALLGASTLKELTKLQNASVPEGNARGLLHGDPSLRNFLFLGPNLRGVVDGSAKIGWFEEDIAACCVFVWQQASRIRDDNAAPFLVNCFVDSYIRSAKYQISIDCVRFLIIRKSLSRAKTCIQLGDIDGAKLAVTLLRTMLAMLGEQDLPIFKAK